MAELYLFDQNDKFINILTEDEGLVDTWFKDYQNHVEDESFVFNVQSNSPLLKYIVDENQVAFYDRNDRLRLARMKDLREVTRSDNGAISHEIRVICEPSFLELHDHFIEDRRITDGTAQIALNRALDGSRYVGEVTVDLGLATDNFYWIDGIEAVFKILKTWGGALKDTITLDDNNEIIERKLWIVQRLGTDNGLIIEPDYNAETISRNTISYPETALWGQGSSLEIEDDEGELTGGHTRYITFEDVEWKVSKGDPVDKPKGQKWVGDPDALARDGYLDNGVRKHRFGHFSNQDYEEPEELLWATWQELQERKLKEIMHEATIYESDKKVSLGDTVTILNREYNKPIELQSQITGLEYDILYPDDEIKIVVGKYIDMNEDPLQKEVDDLKEDIRKPRPTKPIDNGSFPDIEPGTPVNVEAHGAFQTIQLFWDYDSNVYISHYEVYGSQISDFVPDEQTMLYRGRVSAFSHEVSTDEKWYYYVRAVNTRGTPGEFSHRVSASSVRIINDDILFGSIIADHLADGLDIADKLAQNTIDRINDGPMQAVEYTQGEINTVRMDLESRLDGVDGSLINVNEVTNELLGFKTTTIEKISDIDGVLSNQNTAIEQNATDLTFKASETSVSDLTGRMSNAEAAININADNIGLKVDVDGVIASINLSEEGVRIDGNKHHITGQTLIDDAVIGTSAIANLAVDRFHLKYGIIDNVHIKEATIEHTKIKSVNADKITVGTLKGVDVQGARFYSTSGNDWMEWIGGTMEFTKANGHFLEINPSGFFGYNTKGGSVRFQADNVLVTSSALGTSNSNVYLAAGDVSGGHGEARVVSYKSVPGDGEITSYSYRPIRVESVKSRTDRHLYMGTDLEFRVMSEGLINSGVYRPIRASALYANDIESNTSEFLYLRNNGGVRVMRAGNSNTYQPLIASQIIADSIRINESTNLYLGTGSGEVRVTSNALYNNGNPDYKAIKATSFRQASSIKYKTNIQSVGKVGLDVINNLTVLEYDLKSDIRDGVIDNRQLGFIAEHSREIATTDNDAIDIYKLASYNTKAIQELDLKLTNTNDAVNSHELEIKYLKQKIKQLEGAA